MLTHLYDCEQQLSSEMRKKTNDGEQRAGNTDKTEKRNKWEKRRDINTDIFEI